MITTEESLRHSRRDSGTCDELAWEINDVLESFDGKESPEDLDEEESASDEMSEQQWRLVLNHIHQVIHVALKFPTDVLDLEDLVQEGILGLITAARKFDAALGTRFATYAWHWIYQKMDRAVGNNQNLIRWPIYRLEELVPANRDERFVELAPGERSVRYFDGSEVKAEDAIEYPAEESPVRTEVVEALLDSMEDSLTERQQRILRLRFGMDDHKEWTLEEVSEVEGVTRERIRQIQRKAIGSLKYALPAWMRREFQPENQEVN